MPQTSKEGRTCPEVQSRLSHRYSYKSGREKQINRYAGAVRLLAGWNASFTI